MLSCICQVYRSRRHAEMYLLVDKRQGLIHVPAALLAEFGRPEPSITFLLTPSRSMPHAQASRVLAAIETQGFYLQLPPMSRQTTAGWDAYRTPTKGYY